MKVNQQVISRLSQPMFWIGVIGGIKLFLQATNLQIPDGVWNNVANGMAGVFMLIGIIADYEAGKPKPAPAPEPPKPIQTSPQPDASVSQLPATPQG